MDFFFVILDTVCKVIFDVMPDSTDVLLKRSDYDPENLVSFLGVTQLVNTSYFSGSYSIDDRCLEESNFLDLPSNDPNWEHLTIKASQMQFLRTDEGRNKFELSAKGISIIDSVNP